MEHHNRQLFIKEADKRYLNADIALLNRHGVADDVMSLMASQHAARTETLAKAVDPTLGRALLLMISNQLLEAAKEIDAATFQEPEIVHV